MIEGQELRDYIIKVTDEAVITNSSLQNWAESIGVHLWDNQLEILDTILNPSIRNICVTAARGAGKTFIISIAVIKQCIENKNYRVLLFGPKAELAARILADGVRPLCMNNAILSAEVDWDVCKQKEFRFKNGSWIRCLGANDNTQIEGYHCFTGETLILLDDGTQKPIMDIKEGDKVISFNDSGDLVSGEVVATEVRLPDEDLYEVIYELNGSKKVVRCTGSHRFYTKNRGIVEAKDLTDTDILIGVV
jgi:hypothetical protein